LLGLVSSLGLWQCNEADVDEIAQNLALYRPGPQIAEIQDAEMHSDIALHE